MKKLLLSLLALALSFCSYGQNPTLVVGTNGVKNTSTNIAGKVYIGLATNARTAGFVYSSVDGGPNNFEWIAGGGVPSLNATNSNILFTPDGLTIKGTNAFNVNFSGANGTNVTMSNALSGIVRIATPSTNIELNSRRVICGPSGTTYAEQYQDFYVKGQHATLSSFRYDSTAGDTMVSWYLDDASSGGAEFYIARPGGGVGFVTSFGTGATAPVFMRNQGGTDFQIGAQVANTMSLGTISGGTYSPRIQISNSTITVRYNLDGGTNYATNFANLYNRTAMVDHSASVVDNGNALVFFVNTTQWKNGGWRQDPPASNDIFHSYVDIEAGDYVFYAIGVADASFGQQRWDLINPGGTTNVSWSMDWYNAVPAFNTKKIQSVTIPRDGRYMIQSTVTNKNAASSSFGIDLAEYGLTR